MSKIADALVRSYDVRPVEITRIHAGTVTTNFRVTDDDGGEWFAKVYRDRSLRPDELAAVELAEFARSDQVPVPGVRRTCAGKLIDDAFPMSLWNYVDDSETAESGLTGKRWPAVGTVLGNLHRRLADHPAATPAMRPGTGVRDIARSRFDRLISEYNRRGTPFEQWCLDAAEQRRDLLDHAVDILARLPDLTTQVVHGDLASPNLLLRGDKVAAVIDFQSPNPRFLSWELARIGCDPRTILLGDQWLTGLPELLAAYASRTPPSTSTTSSPSPRSAAPTPSRRPTH